MQVHYSMIIEWSDEDQAYLVTLPEWAGRLNTPTTHGTTYEEAARHGQEVLADVVDLWHERGWELPAPRVHATAGV